MFPLPVPVLTSVPGTGSLPTSLIFLTCQSCSAIQANPCPTSFLSWLLRNYPWFLRPPELYPTYPGAQQVALFYANIFWVKFWAKVERMVPTTCPGMEQVIC